jgi:hypothetical protein
MHQEIKDRIVQLLSDVVERSKTINQSSGTPLNLELDLIMEDLRSLYRHFEWLRKQISEKDGLIPGKAIEVSEQNVTEASEPSEPARQAAQMVVEAEPLTEELVHAEQPQRAIEDTKEVIRTAVPEPVIAASPAVPEPVIAASPAAPAAMSLNLESNLKEQIVSAGMESQNQTTSNLGNPTPEMMPSIPQPATTIGSQGATKTRIADRFVSEDNSLHKRLATQKEDRSLGARLQMTPISNLKDAIGVNEKFLFINELFGGNIQIYNEAIVKLNAFQNIDQSFEYLNDLGKTLEWDENRSAQTIEKLAGYVMRRYLVR